MYFQCNGILRDLHSFPTRRSSDLTDPKTRHLVTGVVSGISWYGNCFGCPTVGGEIAFAPEYAGNPLVNVMCVGLVRGDRSEEHTSELQSHSDLVCRLLLEKKKKNQ